ncbi:MAG: hypothetical protein NC043_05750 [Muribaculaceae bacterium]|nr:hypothetical protein [Muribaculaceae bacterium]
MDTFAIILSVVGMLLFPIGRYYIMWQKDRQNARFLSGRYRKAFKNTLRIASTGICSVAILLLLLLEA